jgi:hypothetical protein
MIIWDSTSKKQVMQLISSFLNKFLNTYENRAFSTLLEPKIGGEADAKALQKMLFTNQTMRKII